MLPTVRAQPTTFSPCWTNARATAAPMPPEAPVTSASRSRHRSMPALAMVPSRPPTPFGEPGTEITELGRSLVTAGAGAGNLQTSEQRLVPPPCGPASGRGSALGTSAPGHIAPEDRRGLAAVSLERPRGRPFRPRPRASPPLPWLTETAAFQVGAHRREWGS